MNQRHTGSGTIQHDPSKSLQNRTNHSAGKNLCTRLHDTSENRKISPIWAPVATLIDSTELKNGGRVLNTLTQLIRKAEAREVVFNLHSIQILLQTQVETMNLDYLSPFLQPN
ncbi:hypothetical protein A3843_00850 [Pseudovibrio exalbescens]|uniref:Uncharacterized protein n=1 Tax=Pseudovibrio exalbescens TaxID=197461 RepID=A0A1U7JBY8_9HYPH|nr:hypothetical protein A3843_00850 [Pseudovibrio exalbescens]